MIYQISEDYACADLILRLPGHAPMPAFREVEDVPLVVRHARKSRQQVVMATSPSDAVQYSLAVRHACKSKQQVLMSDSVFASATYVWGQTGWTLLCRC